MSDTTITETAFSLALNKVEVRFSKVRTCRAALRMPTHRTAHRQLRAGPALPSSYITDGVKGGQGKLRKLDC